MVTKAFNADEVTCQFGDDQITSGFVLGVFIKIKREAPVLQSEAGLGGEVAVSRNDDDRTTVEISMLGTSDGNDVFCDAYLANKKGPGLPGIKGLFIRDRNGRSVFKAEHAAVMELPELAYDRTATPRTWKLQAFDPSNEIRGSAAI